MSKFGNQGLQRLKARTKGPAKAPPMGVGHTDQQFAEHKAKMDKIIARNQKKMGYKPVNQKPQVLDAERLNDPNYFDDSLFTKLKTVVSNPFDSLTAIMGTNPNITSLKQVRELHEAKEKGSKDADDILKRSEGLNTVSSFIPVVAAADALVSLSEGDPKAIIAKKINKIKPVAAGLKKLKVDPKKASQALGIGLRASKKL